MDKVYELYVNQDLLSYDYMAIVPYFNLRERSNTLQGVIDLIIAALETINPNCNIILNCESTGTLS